MSDFGKKRDTSAALALAERLERNILWILGICFLFSLALASGILPTPGSGGQRAARGASAPEDSGKPTPPSPPDNALYSFCRNGTCGFVDARGTVVITPRFASARDFGSGDLAVISDKQGKQGLVDRTGTLVVPPRYGALCGTFVDGRTPAQQWKRSFGREGRWGYVDRTGTWVIQPRFEAALPFHPDGVAPAKTRGRFGVINRNGAWIVPPRFAYIGPFSAGGLAAAGDTNGLWGVIDRTGAWVTPPGFQRVRPGAEGDDQILFQNNEDGSWHVTGSPTAEAPPAGFTDTRGFAPNGLAAARSTDGLWGYLDRAGAWAIPPGFSEASTFSPDGLAAVQTTGGLWGYIDPTGAWRIPPRYHTAGSFSAGAALVTEKNTAGGEISGRIDRTGTWIYRYDTACGREILRDATGTIAWPQGFSETCPDPETQTQTQTPAPEQASPPPL